MLYHFFITKKENGRCFISVLTGTFWKDTTELSPQAIVERVIGHSWVISIRPLVKFTALVSTFEIDPILVNVRTWKFYNKS